MPNAERQWSTFERGEVRELVLRSFRNALRQLKDPETGEIFDEAVIRRVTVAGGRFYVEADAIDLVGLALEKRHEFQAQQVRIDRAAGPWLLDFHGGELGEEPLPATGGSGPVTAQATAGTIFQGSTTVPDPLATIGTDATGQRFQVLVSATTPPAGSVELTVVGIDTGIDTNLTAGTEITWSNPPPGAQPKATVAEDFSGGTDAETHAEFADRLLDIKRHKPASGNWAHFRHWARQASNAVQNVWVYPCALHAGTVLVAVAQKRGSGSTLPGARVPSIGTLAAVTNYLVPPTSPVVPGRAWVLVVPLTPENCDVDLLLAMPRASDAGWADAIPFPYYPKPAGQHAEITAINVGGNPLKFTLSSQQSGGPTNLPGKADLATVNGTDCPQMMIWDHTTNVFEKLLVSQVVDAGGGIYTVTLTSAPAVALAVNKRISPLMTARDTLAQAIRDHFDSLGPGEIIDLATDDRAARAFRRPSASESNPQRVGSLLGQYLFDAFGATLADLDIHHANPATPSLPTDPASGPKYLVPQHVGVYSF